MSFQERSSDGLYDYIPPRKIVIPDTRIVMAEEKFLFPLCTMCKHSRLTCDNGEIKGVEVPMEPGDDPADEVISYIQQLNGTYKKQGMGTKVIDGVKAGILNSEEDIEIPFVCGFFKPKDLG
jgi:hypothetical protein